MAASSPYDNAAATVRTPATTQLSMSQPLLPTSRAISPATIKIPEPIIDPATIMVESNNPSDRLSFCGAAESEVLPETGAAALAVVGEDPMWSSALEEMVR